MTFLWPAMLWFLLAVPLLVMLYVRIQQRRKQFSVRYGSFGLVQQAAAGQGRGPGVRRHVPALLFLIGIIILLLALARPEMVVSLPKVEGIVILAFDASGSMAADDMNPTRMEAAKTVARDFVARQPSTVQVGVVAFSDSGFSVQPPTNDNEAINAALDRLSPQRSTSLATGITVSLDTIDKLTLQAPEDSEDFPPELLPTPTPVPPGTYSPSVIVLITDGENTSNPDPLEAAQEAARRGVRIHTIGIGSPTGTTLEVEGFLVHTQLDEAMLRQISEMTGGVYYNAATEDDLRDIYEKIDPQLVIKREKTEITSILAGISILVLLAGGFLSLFWFGRVP
jgi:Ca-activated chloride channel family protein